jgi:cholesterol oxidase
MTKLSSDIGELGSHYEFVVVGSGYGGAISACRLARAGRDVCLLERGRERWPGEYPDNAWEAVRDLQVHLPGGRHGDPTGLFDFHSGDVSAVVGCGLGGTSLINANVSKKPDERLWEQPCWPNALATDKAGRDAAYERARAMLNPKEPRGHPTRKLAALHAAAVGAGMSDKFSLAPLNVVFEDCVNAAGVEQHACSMCGDCCTGCNVGAKTTTLMTYLPDAWHHGAKIFTEVSVRHLERDGDAWIVHFDLVGVGRERFRGGDSFVRADHVVLAAGTYGSTEILLRSKREGLSLSDRVGHSYSGNGDVLAFAYDCKESINGVGFGDRFERADADRSPKRAGRSLPVEPVGPCIQGIVDCRDTSDVLDGHVVEEGSIPGAIGIGMPEALTAFTLFHVDRAPEARHHDLHAAIDAAKSLLGGPRHGAVGKTLTYLVQGHDGADGVLDLDEHDHLRMSWPDPGLQPTFKQADDLLQQLTEPLGGLYSRDPLWNEHLDWRLITTHPLGGCPMGESAEVGVVDDACRVFSGRAGSDVYDSLFVMDGAAMPTSLGVNPLFTISAVAERACEKLCEREGWRFDADLVNGKLELPDFETVMLRFTETMHGTIIRGGDESDISFLVTIEVADVDALERDPGIEHALAGTVVAPALDQHTLTIDGGTFRLFADDPNRLDVQEMRYRLPLVDQQGNRWLLLGDKTLNDSSPFQAWHETTTLAVTLYQGDDDSGAPIAHGTMHLDALDFAHQLRTIEVIGAKSTTERLRTIAKFGRVFAKEMFERYGSVVAPDSVFDPDKPPRKRRALRAPVREIYDLPTEDDHTLRLTRFNGGSYGPVLLVHGLGVSSEIFSTDLIDTNLVEYLTGHGYDVWLLDLRVSIALRTADEQSTADEIARYDHPAAVDFVLNKTGAQSLQEVVHCFGSNTFIMSMLGGWIDPAKVRSVVCSQVAAHLKTGLLARFEGGVHLPGMLHALGVDSLSAYVDADADWKSRLFDDMLRLEYVPPGQHCRSAVCHRVTFVYGLLYQHEELSVPLHDNLHELFGVANMSSLEHLAAMVRKGHLVDADSKSVYIEPGSNLARLKLPIRFISGADNRCYLPESTERTRQMLAEANGSDLYDRVVIDGYGHLDSIFGAHAVADVYPRILEHLNKTATPAGPANP